MIENPDGWCIVALVALSAIITAIMAILNGDERKCQK